MEFLPTLKGPNFCREHFNDAHHKDMETLPETAFQPQKLGHPKGK